MKASWSGVLLFAMLLFAGCNPEPPAAGSPRAAAPATLPAFTVFDPAPGFQPPPIVLQYDPATKTGANWAEIGNPPWHVSTPPVMIGRAANYLREGIARMTGVTLPVVSTNDLSRGIVLTLLQHASADIQNDRGIRQALAPDPGNSYAANEAFAIRSETNRLLVVANTANGLLAAVVELLEATGYEILGMGPNWIHAPDYRTRRLALSLDRAGRPGFYIRNQWATSGQSYGVGTITEGLTDPSDEPVMASYWRWQIGTRMAGRSMPNFPGHALQGYHARVLKQMSREKTTEGFLAPKILVGPLTDRPPPDEANSGWLWVNADTNAAAAELAFTSTGKAWQPGAGANIDISSPLVRRIILDDLIQQASERIKRGVGDPPDNLIIFPMDPEDGGGYGQLGVLSRHPRWYPEYLASEGAAFGRPYILHGCNGLDQPIEVWDPEAASDHVYGLANYLLREFDKWVDAQPEAARATADGQSIKELVRCSFYCYNYHDVPPNFNLDPRIRVMIAGYPKHRGRGKWEKFASQEDLARAFKRMLPREPSGDYRIAGIAYYHDQSSEGIPAGWDASPVALAQDYRQLYDAGYRAVSIETDFNFGKYGLAYYLTARMLWNPDLTAVELDAVRDRWLQRAYGSAWREMKAYYDFMLKRNFTINGPNFWAQAIRLIDAAAGKLDAAREPEAVRRIDDLKLFWYYHYLLASDTARPDAPVMLEFLWKGQMSYMVAMHGPVRKLFTGNGTGVGKLVGEALAAGPAHYTPAETEAWWAKVLGFWPYVAVASFSEGRLADGTPAGGIDLNDLVSVAEFQGDTADVPFYANCGTSSPRDLTMLTVARRPGDPVGFKLHWPFLPDRGNQYHALKVPYGVDIWNPKRREWEPWIDRTMTSQQSAEVTDASGKRLQVAEINLTAPRAGVYRLGFDRGGDLCGVSSLGFDPVSGKSQQVVGFTFLGTPDGHTQSPAYFYIPKGTRSLDFEIWDRNGGKTLVLYKGLPATRPALSRKLDVSRPGAHVIALEPGEDGTVAALHSNGFRFPFLYSIPTLWAKSPGALLVPRAIAAADGLTPVDASPAAGDPR